MTSPEWLNLSFDIPIHTCYRQGTYFKSNCGGESDWSITNEPLANSIISIPYKGEKYCYQVSFYESNPDSNVLTATLKLFSAGSIHKLESGFVCLTNKQLENYDHKNEYLADFEEGSVYFADLS